MKTVNRTLRLGIAVILLNVVLAPTITSAAPPPSSSGNLLIYRVGDGSAALGTTATAVFLDEYDMLGTLVQSIPLPTSGASALTAVGNSTTEGTMSLSQDATKVVFTGYRKDAGGTSPASDAPATTPRVIATVSLAGLVNTSVALTDAGGNGSIRSATSVDGVSTFYTSASAGFVRYIGTPTGSSTSMLIDGRNSRQLILNGNRLYAANGSTAIAGKVQEYGILPTGATPATPLVTLPTADAVNGFALFDLSPTYGYGGGGVDTIYALDTVAGQLIKWSYDNTSWTAKGSITTSAANLTGYDDLFGVHLFLTTGSALLSELDTSGWGVNITGSLTTLATAGANTAFRGIAIIPEPSTFSLAFLGLAGLLALRRRQA